MKLIFLSMSFILFCHISLAESSLRLAIAGLSHGHVDWIFNRENKGDVELIGVYETNPELIDRYVKRYNMDRSLFFTDLETMLDQLKPEAVSAFGPISEHVEIVRACAPRKIHVMVEKPLAYKVAEAEEIKALSEKYQIHVLTNYETSWYESNQQLKKLLDDGKLGQLRKVMVNDGHEGPKEIGVSKEFLEILTDPDKNGAGALVDFGCYGANLMTWLMRGKRPLSVMAVVQQNKPHIYKKVDDEASIVLQYREAQCVIQGSWNWPFSRKDMEVYGTDGYAIAVDAMTVRYRLRGNKGEEAVQLAARPTPHDDPFSVLAAVVRDSLVLDDLDLYGLKINYIATEILEAAIQSAKEHKIVFLQTGE